LGNAFRAAAVPVVTAVHRRRAVAIRVVEITLFVTSLRIISRAVSGSAIADASRDAALDRVFPVVIGTALVATRCDARTVVGRSVLQGADLFITTKPSVWIVDVTWIPRGCGVRSAIAAARRPIVNSTVIIRAFEDPGGIRNRVIASRALETEFFISMGSL
jgi:hypothetical protein